MAFWGLFWVNFCPLIFFLLWLSLWLLTWQCLDHLQECALCEFYFPFVSVQSREIHGSFPSLSPFPSHLLWFPFVCFESQRHRALCPDFNSSARERCSVHAWCLLQGWPTQKWSGAVDPRAMKSWDLFTRRGKIQNLMGAMYFVIHANICVPGFFLGVGGRVGMCHS